MASSQFIPYFEDPFLRPQYWGPKELNEIGLVVNAELIRAAIASAQFWGQKAAGLTRSAKAYQDIDTRLVEQDSRLGSNIDLFDLSDFRIGGLPGAAGGFVGVKCIHASSANPQLGLQRHHIEVAVKDQLTGAFKGMVEGVAISDLRTAHYAEAAFDLYLGNKDNVEVFIFGAGAVAKAVVEILHAGNAADKIACITVCSRSINSAGTFVRNMATITNFTFRAIDGANKAAALLSADLVVTATGKTCEDDTLIDSKQEMKPAVVTVSLGSNELPSDFIEEVLRNGTAVVDDTEVVSARRAQALALYFESQGETLAAKAAEYGIKELHELLPAKYPAELPEVNDDREGPVHLACSGLSALDVAGAAYVLRMIAQIHNKVL